MTSSSLLHSLCRRAFIASVGACLVFTSGCATTESTSGSGMSGTNRALAVPATTGKVFTRAEMQVRTSTHYFGDEAYAEVNSAWLRNYYDEFRSELFRLGVVGWNERFDCNRFTEFYIGLAQARFYRESFHSRTPARALAIGPYWYVRENGQGSHAVIQALTERGRIFIDPQSGKEVELSPIETALAYFQFF